MRALIGLSCSSLGRVAPLVLLVWGALCCDKKSDATGGGYVATTSKRDPDTVKQPEPKPQAAPESASAPKNEKDNAKPKADEHADASPEYSELTDVWGLGKLHDLGPAGPATATPKGVYFVTRDDRLVLAPRKGDDGFVPLDAKKMQFAKYGRGPAISKTHAYWVSERRLLLRAPLSGGKVEVLARHARLGTRTSVVTTMGRDVVTFIAEIDEKPLAFVWASKGSAKAETLRLTPQGATATSASLVAGDPHPRAVILAGRLGMSPIHVRRIRVTKKRLTLEPDEVVWVGPGSHVLTEITGITRQGDETVAFLPTAKDFNDFGLAQLTIGAEPGEIEEPDWRIYPNGLDPAPVATGHFCKKNYVLYARPTESRPRSPQELHLAEIADGAPRVGEVVARSRAFNDLSLAPSKNGAVAAWTADRRTWGMILSCPQK